jgi:hypothetical protein
VLKKTQCLRYKDQPGNGSLRIDSLFVMTFIRSMVSKYSVWAECTGLYTVKAGGTYSYHSDFEALNARLRRPRREVRRPPY